MRVHEYQKLTVWQKAMDLVELVYQTTEDFPDSEKFGLVSQARRSAVSIPSNIAEGSLRGTQKDFRHFLRIAFASGAELETQLLLAERLGFIADNNAAREMLTEVMKMLNKLIQSNSQNL